MCCVVPSPFAWCCRPLPPSSGGAAFPSPFAWCLPSPPSGGAAFSPSSPPLGGVLGGATFSLSSVGLNTNKKNGKREARKKQKLQTGLVPKTGFDPPKSFDLGRFSHTNFDLEKREKRGKKERNKRRKK